MFRAEGGRGSESGRGVWPGLRQHAVQSAEPDQHTERAAVEAGLGGMFSLESGTGQRFLTRSRVFTECRAGRVIG